jgi:hypothetical protein
MRLAFFGIVAFVLGLSGSTGVLVFTAPAHSPAADSLAVRQARAAAAARDAGTAPPLVAVAPATSVQVPVPVRMPADTATGHPAPGAAIAAVAATAEGAHAPVVTRVPPALVNAAAAPAAAARTPLAPGAESFKQVGSILLNMKPAEAARIVAYLNDDQVEGLLRSMSTRQAAVVFAQLPPERAAALSKRLLIPAKEERP